VDKHFIVLNGKRYDAVTGQLLQETAAKSPVKTESRHIPARSVHAPRISTGRVHSVTAKQRRAAVEASHAAVAHKPSAPKAPRHHATPRHAAPHKPQPAKTLMRRVVTKPDVAAKPSVKMQYPIITTKSGISVQAPKRLAHHVNPNRLTRAKQVPQSHYVGRFQANALQPIKPKVTHLSVAKAPAHTKQVNSARHTASPAAPGHIVTPRTPTSIKVNIFEEALAEARSHEQKAPKRKKNVSLLAGASFASLLLIGGIVSLFNTNTIEMQLASVQAGFPINTPTHTPSGFEKSTTEVAGKSVALNFVSPIDQRSYTLSQESSSWDSQTLFDHITETPGVSYQVLQNKGRNIYIYGKSKAAWVDGGILYKLSGNANLSTDDIIGIAGSL
jgi:hypothetical protein